MRNRRIVTVAVGAAVAGLATVLTPLAVAALSADPKADALASVSDPAENLSDADREAAYLAQLDANTAARNEWVSDFEDSGRSVADLQQVELDVQTVAPLPTLDAALAASDLAVRGVVTDLTFTPASTVATVRVEDVVKGSAPAELRVDVGGGPEPDRGYGTGVLALDPSMPFLFEGTRAVLLLEREPAGTALPAPYSVQAHTGTYLVDDAGLVRPHETNPFRATVDGMPVAAFTALLRAAAAT
jgi:hypothetical protein